MSDDKAEEIKRNILSPAQWIRILYMAFYAVACWVLLFVLPVIIVCQIIISLITGIDNRNLRDFGKELSDYFHQAMDYLVYASDDKPWPFTEGEDLGDAGFVDDDDSKSGSSVPQASTGMSNDTAVAETDAETQGSADDVFSDISFTGDQDSDTDTSSGDDATTSATDVDDDNKKDPA